jgi:hypothetical protein
MAKLNSENRDTRVEAIDTMTFRLAENTQDKALALSWRLEALKEVEDGVKFSFDEKVVDFAKIKATEDYTEPSTELLAAPDYARIKDAPDMKTALDEFNTILTRPAPTAEETILEDLAAKRQDVGLTLTELNALPPEQKKLLADQEAIALAEEEAAPLPELFQGQQVDYTGKGGITQRVTLIDQNADGT